MSEWVGLRSIRPAFAGVSGGYLAPSAATSKPAARLATDPRREGRRWPEVPSSVSPRAAARLVIAYE